MPHKRFWTFGGDYAIFWGCTEGVLRIIAHNRAWMKSYKITLGLTKNPKTPVAVSMNLLPRIALAVAVLVPLAAPAQKLYKCVDAKGKITYQEAACPVDKEQKKVDTSHAGKTDWERAANEKVKRSR